MFGTQRQYRVRLRLLRYQPYTKSWNAVKKFVKTLSHDPSDDVGIREIMAQLKHSRTINLRVKEKEAKLLQKMQEKGQIEIGYIENI